MTDMKQTFMEHLIEFRKTLFYCFISLLLCFILLFVFFCDTLMDFLLAPIRSFGIDLVYTALAEVWVTKMKVSFIAAVIVSFPLVVFFLWRFIRPALYQNERKILEIVFFCSMFLFLLGISFAYGVVLSLTINFFVVTGADTALPMLTIAKYVGFLMSFVIPFGIVFLFPLVIYVFTKLGIISPGMLVKSRKYVLVFLIILAAILTPPDVISQLLLFFPMAILWEISIFVAKRVKVDKERDSLAEDQAS